MSQKSALEIIQSVLEQIRPIIMGDGGNIEFVKYEDNIVFVKLHGACVSCPASFFTLKLGVEEAIKAQLPEVLEVIALEE